MLFKPAWWLKNCHLQTIYSIIFPRKIKLALIREQFVLSDGDSLVLDWTENKFEQKPLIVLLHGLEGSSDSPYIKGMMKKALESNFRCVCMHFRGCAEIYDNDYLPLKKSYHAGETHDLDNFIENLDKKLESKIPIFIIGYSLGGNVLLKWLSESKYYWRVSAAAAVSVPFELVQTANKLRAGFSKIYQWKLINDLKKSMLKKFQNLFTKEKLNKIKTFWEFDDQITAPMHGFLNVHDYYSKSSSRQYLSKIKTKTLIIHALDDPFLSENAIPAKRELSSYIEFELYKYGGHVGFIEGNIPFFPEFYLERRIMQYFKQVLDELKC